MLLNSHPFSNMVIFILVILWDNHSFLNRLEKLECGPWSLVQAYPWFMFKHSNLRTKLNWVGWFFQFLITYKKYCFQKSCITLWCIKACKSYCGNALKIWGPIGALLTPHTFLTIQSNCGLSHSSSNYVSHMFLFQMI